VMLSYIRLYGGSQTNGRKSMVDPYISDGSDRKWFGRDFFG